MGVYDPTSEGGRRRRGSVPSAGKQAPKGGTRDCRRFGPEGW